MKDIYVDVEIRLDAAQLAKVADPGRYALEVSRDVAKEKCSEAGAELRTDRAPEVVINRGLEAVSGRDLFLVATRWAVVAPDGVSVTP